MDRDKTAIEILKEFAKNSGRKVEFSEKPYPSSPLHPVTYHRRTLYIPNNKSETSYFVCFGDSKEFGTHATYSGVFIPVNLPTSTTIKVRKKDIFDKLNLFKKKKHYNTGIRYFDSQVVITGNDPTTIRKIFKNRNMQNLINTAYELEAGLFVAINDVNVEFVPGLKSKSHIGIYSIQEWLLDSVLIENLFNLIERFREQQTRK